MADRPSIPLRCAEAALALLLFVAFLSVRDLPSVDLPQHTLQLANWLRIDAGDPSVDELELNFRTPYLLAYPLARALGPLVLELPAFKLVLAGCVVLQALALRRLCTRLGHDPWLGLLGFPLGLGYSFCFGFVSFCAAIPLVYLAFIWVVSHRDGPTLQSGLRLAGLLALLLIAHGVALGFTLLVLGPLLLRGAGRLWQRALPLSSPAVLALVWLTPARSSTRLGGDLWRFEPERVLELPGQLAGIGAADWTATLAGLGILAVLALNVSRPRARWLFVPLVLALAGYLFFPTMFRGAGPLGPRFSVYLVPALLLALPPKRSTPRAAVTIRTLTALLAFGVVLLFCSRLHAFNRETAEFHRLTRHLPAGLRIRPLVFDRTSPAFPHICIFRPTTRCRKEATRDTRLPCTASRSCAGEPACPSRWAEGPSGHPSGSTPTARRPTTTTSWFAARQTAPAHCSADRSRRPCSIDMSERGGATGVFPRRLDRTAVRSPLATTGARIGRFDPHCA